MEANDGKLFCGVVGGEARFSPQGSDFVEIDVLAGLCHGVVGADGSQYPSAMAHEKSSE